MTFKTCDCELHPELGKCQLQVSLSEMSLESCWSQCRKIPPIVPQFCERINLINLNFCIFLGRRGNDDSVVTGAKLQRSAHCFSPSLSALFVILISPTSHPFYFSFLLPLKIYPNCQYPIICFQLLVYSSISYLVSVLKINILNMFTDGSFRKNPFI